jgi:hypothetical protein
MTAEAAHECSPRPDRRSRTNNHHAPWARIPDLSFGDGDTISAGHYSVLLSHLFLKHLDAEISENRSFLTVSRGEEGRRN